MSVDEQETQGRGLFEADAGNVPELSVDRDAVIRGGRQRRGRRRAIVVGAAAASVAVAAVGWSVFSGLGGDAPITPAGETDQVSDAGWRVLSEGQDQGEPGRTEVATTDEQLERVWREAGFSDPAPVVDWDSEIVIWFGAIWSSGREIHLTDVVVESDAVYPLTPTVEPDYGGADDARAHAFVVAVDRSSLPTVVPFNVQLGAEPVGYGWPQERTIVDVDLRQAGATATDEQLRDDPDLTPPTYRHVEDGDSIEVGEEVIFWFSPGECGWELLGTFDGLDWRLSDETVPPQGLPPIEGDAMLTRLAEDQLHYSIPEADLIYVPAEDGWTCDPA